MLLIAFIIALTSLVEKPTAAAVAHRVHDANLPLSTAPPEPGSSAARIQQPKPTAVPDRNLIKRQYGTKPSGANEVAGLPGAVCVTRGGTDLRSTSTLESTGLQWVPYVPLDGVGQIVYFGTDTDGILFENVNFVDPPSSLLAYTTLLQPYSNSSGWSMVMPSTIPDTLQYWPEITYTATGTGTGSYNALMTVFADCASDTNAPLTTSSTPPDIPFINSFFNIPAINGCSYYATTTATWTSVMPLRTGELIVPAYEGDNIQDFWNQTGAVWTLSTGNDSAEVAWDFPKYMEGGMNPSLFFTMAPKSTAFNFTIPDWRGIPTGPGIQLSATTISGAPAGITSYTITASAQYACTSDTFANPIYQGAVPCTEADPLFVTDTENWIYRNVDYSLSNWWSNGPTRTTPSQPNVPAPTATESNSDALPKQLAWQALNVEVDCSLAGDCISQSAIDFCQADQNPRLPIWTYLALMAIANLHTQLKNIYDNLGFASITVGDWGLGFVDEFTNDVQKAAELTAEQVALAVTGLVVSVLAAFIPMINFEKVGANVAAADAKAGGITPGEGGLLGIAKNPNAPKGDLNPETDPVPPAGSDVEQFWTQAEQMEAGAAGQPGVLNPGENWAQDFSYVDTRATRNPIMVPPATTDEDEIALTPDIGRRESEVLLGTIPGNVLQGAQGLWSKYDPNSVNTAQQGGLWQGFVGNITAQMQKQLDIFTTAIMTDPTMTDVLLTYLYGGTYISGQIDLSILTWFLRTDLTARAINNVWSSYEAYVSFTRLGDPPYGNSTPACDAHLAGPQLTKFCGVGGVFYLYMLSQGSEDQGAWSPNGGDLISSFPGQIMPYGLDKFETDALLNLTASGPTEGSARAWNATQQVNITAAESQAMSDNIGGMLNAADTSEIYSIVGRLPGEWAIPVCNQGTNSWGADYTKSTTGYNIGYLPCACGYQGNETASFFQAIGISDSDLYNLAFYCCEGSLLFPEKSRGKNKITNNNNTGPGAAGLDGGVWPDSSPLYYGTITAEDIHNKPLHCSSSGVLTPAPNTD